MQLNQLQQKTERAHKKRVGRGGSRGKTSGHGTKGQKARAGHRMRPEMRDIIKKIPKLRGYGKNRARTVDDSVIKATPVNLALLDKEFADGDVVTPEVLLVRRLVSRVGGGVPHIKILGTGDITKKISVSGCLFSQSAKSAIEKAGGSIV